MIFLTSCNGQESYYNNKYYEQNINPTEWFDGMNPKRLLNLKGEIIEITHFAYMPSSINEKELKLNSGTNNYILKFNQEGKIIEEQGFRDTEQIASKTKYFDFYNFKISSLEYYDKNQKVSRSEKLLFNSNNVLVGKEIFNGDLILMENYHPKESKDSVFTKNRFYNMIYLKGNLISQISLNNHNKWIYDYYLNGKRKYKCSYENELPKIEEKYNKQGLLKERTHYYYDTSGIVNETSKYINKYQDNLKMSTDEIHTINGKIFITTIEYMYDEYNRLETTNRTRSNRTEIIGYVKYNELGDITERKYENELTEFKNYKYDENNNWIEREEWINDKFYFKYKRLIKYK